MQQFAMTLAVLASAAIFHVLNADDPATRSYPGVLMSGTGRTFVDGTWDEATRTMRFRGTFPDP